MIKKEGDFVDYFYNINFDTKEKKNFNKYLNSIKYRSNGLSPKSISELINKSKSTIENWIYNNNNKPFTVRLLDHYKVLGQPIYKKWTWLSINSTRGGLFTGPWISVPTKIKNYKDICKVIIQLPILPATFELAKEFNISKENLKKLRPCFLAYILGILIGDATKETIKRKYRSTRRITLRLTKKYKSSKDICEFVMMTINSLGLRMKRNKDASPSHKSIHYMYRYGSQSSQLIQWMFNICLGLKDNENTTYNSIKSGWLLKMPREFKIWFLKGIGDSDGYVDLGTFHAGLISNCNYKLLKNIFDSMNIHTHKKFLHKDSLEAVMVNIKDAMKLPLFNEYAKSHRYKWMYKVAKAKRFHSKWPEWLDRQVKKYLKKDLSTIEIVKLILNKYQVAIGINAIRKRKEK